jgi:hypothetical protein
MTNSALTPGPAIAAGRQLKNNGLSGADQHGPILARNGRQYGRRKYTQGACARAGKRA